MWDGQGSIFMESGMGFCLQYGMTRGLGAGALGIAALVLAGPASADGAERFVAAAGSNTANDCLAALAPCLTIQRAVDQANPGDTIRVAAGTYPVAAPITVNKANLTISGAEAGSTTVSRTAGNYGFDLQANADGTEISGLAVDNAGAMGTLTGGVRAAATGGSLASPIVLDDVTLRDVTITDFRYGVDVPNTVQSSGWTLDGIDAARQDIGLRLNGKIDDLAITDSTIEGNDQGLSSQYGSSSQKLPGRFSDVTISNSSFDANSTKGIYTEQAENVVIEDSSFIGTGTIPCVRACPDATPTNAIDVNVKWTDFSGLTIRDSVIADTNYVGSAAFGSPSAAVAIKARNDGPTYSPVPATLDDVNLVNLVLSGNEEGAVDFGNAVTGATLRNSRILGNGTAITSYVDPGAGSTIHAEDNWWGCDAGPGLAGCDANAGDVDADPRLVVSVGASPATVAPGGASQLTAEVTTNSDGGAVSGALTSLDGLPVDFGTDLGSILPANTPLSGGVATSTFSSGATPGTATVTAEVDGQTGQGAVSVVDPPRHADPPETEPEIVLPGPDRDIGIGTDAADAIIGTLGDDVLDGLGGDDQLFGGLGDDLVNGGDGADELRGGPGGDEVRGGTGDDDIGGGSGGDFLRGGPGADHIVGGPGEDDIGSGSGEDTIDAQDGEHDAIRCGPDEDDLDADGLDSFGPNCENVS